jgi:hypothetical protein
VVGFPRLQAREEVNPNIVLDDNTGPALSLLLTPCRGIQFDDDNVAAAYLHT